MKRPITRSFLVLSGAISVAIGGAILLAPHAFHASNQVMLGSNPNLMSEVRAPGGLLLASGLVMILGAVRQGLMKTGLLTAALVFGMYGISRLVSLIVDGIPSSTLIAALVTELCVGALAAILLAKPGRHRFSPDPGVMPSGKGAGQ